MTTPLGTSAPAAAPPPLTVSAAAGASGGSQRGPFAIMTVLFFMWGFMTVFNDILIPRFKAAFQLDYFQAMLVQFAFFGAMQSRFRINSRPGETKINAANSISALSFLSGCLRATGAEPKL